MNKLFIKCNHKNLTSGKKEVLIALEHLGKSSVQVKSSYFFILRKKC